MLFSRLRNPIIWLVHGPMTDADVIFFENALVLLKESTEIMQIIILIRLECWWTTCLSDLFGANEPTFLAFAPNFHTHLTPE
jgi:hypothetical protein